MRAATIRSVASLFPPGSSIARSRGCLCSQIDNHFGRGVGEIPGQLGERPRLFVVRDDCPIKGHGKPVEGKA